METRFVLKHNGIKENYDKAKAVNSILNTGVPKEKVTLILSQIEPQLHDGISTKELYELIYSAIERAGLPGNYMLYRLRESLANIDSIDFEKVVGKIIEKEGYTTKWNTIVPGLCVEHQVDIIATRGNETFFVEVKRHRNPHRDSGLGYVAELWARFDDLKQGFLKNSHRFDFTTAWLFTNTKFSDHAKLYASCKKLRLTGWRYTYGDSKNSRENQGLEKMIELIGPKEINAIISRTVYHQNTVEKFGF